MANEMVLPVGQKVLGGSAGAKANDSFEAVYDGCASDGAAVTPKVELPVCNTPIGQVVK